MWVLAGALLGSTGILLAYGDTVDGDGLNGGETAWRWIGLRIEDAHACPIAPPATGWISEPLFTATENPSLQRFCVYRRTDAGDSRPLRSLPLVRLDPDVMGIAAQGSALADATWQALETHFRSQAGQVDLPSGPPSSIRLTVVDTSPTGTAAGAAGPEGAAASSPHGTALLNMARDLVCDPTEVSCRATVAARLAMAWVCFDPVAPGSCRDATHGGYVGLVSELAQAIHHEVSAQGGLPKSRLILNLSLGWHQTLGGAQTQVDDMPTPVQAVYRALEDAVCRGALPIVAAGNRDAAASEQSGPFLPALWETRPAPSHRDCRRLGIRPAGGLDGPAAYRPLVFSVAGLEASDEPLDTTRQDGVPPLAAFADHAVVALSDGSGPTGTLTGSSVAALVVSATAATVWSYQPRADAFQVMAALYASGTALGRTADYCLGSTGCAGRSSEVRRIGLCQAVAAACVDGAACVAPACDTPAALDLADADLEDFELVQQLDMTSIDDDLGPLPSCGGETVLYDDNKPRPQFPCPHRQLDGPTLMPWTEPQPQSFPCPNCLGAFGSPGTVFFEVDDLWRGPLTSATLRCGDTTYALGLGLLRAGHQVRLTHVPAACLTSFPTILSFVHGTDRAVLSPLRLCEDCR